MIRKLTSGKYRLYSRKSDPKTGRRRNLGTFGSRAAAERHERAPDTAGWIGADSSRPGTMCARGRGRSRSDVWHCSRYH